MYTSERKRNNPMIVCSKLEALLVDYNVIYRELRDSYDRPRYVGEGDVLSGVVDDILTLHHDVFKNIDPKIPFVLEDLINKVCDGLEQLMSAYQDKAAGIYFVDTNSREYGMKYAYLQVISDLELVMYAR